MEDISTLPESNVNFEIRMPTGGTSKSAEIMENPFTRTMIF
jgi:hypothetical protein